MPKPFLHLVAEKIIKDYNSSMGALCVVLPNRRAALFLKRILTSKVSSPVLSPRMMMIDELCAGLSGMVPEDRLALSFRLYRCYLGVYGEQAEPFESFVKWSDKVLQDYNEIDHFLVDARDLFGNLTDAKAIERWGVEHETPELMAHYLAFWKGLLPLYVKFREQLEAEGTGYSGMIYRKAAENAGEGLERVLDAEHCTKYLFLGFNALNLAEEKIITMALDKGIADILFDADEYYLDDPQHEAGMFLRRYRDRWKYFEKQPFSFVSDSMRQTKRSVHIIGVPRQVGMARAAGQILGGLHPDTEQLPEQIALVPAEESLLLPLLNSIPESFSTINVTMGLTLKHLPLSNAVVIAFEAQERAERLSKADKRPYKIYHLDLERMLLSGLYSTMLPGGEKQAHEAMVAMRRYNVPFLDVVKIAEWLPGSEDFIKLLEPQQPTQLLGALAQALARFHQREKIDDEERETAALLQRICLRLQQLFGEYGLEPDMTTALHLLRQLMRSENINFYGEPLRGLQVMGLLETRLLTFGTVILTSANEGILPGGKAENSFIPYDLKVHFGLPTFREKDAIYAYHFYRLIQRAEKVYLIYNTEVDRFGSSEVSRYAEQIKRGFRAHSNTSIVEEWRSPEISQSTMVKPFSIAKGDYIEEQLKALAQRGISPSRLIDWVRDPSRFYLRAVLGLEESKELDEALPVNTMGNVVHGVLEDFYAEFKGGRPYEKDFNAALGNAEALVEQKYAGVVGRKPEGYGRNKLRFDVLVEMVRNTLEADKAFAAQCDRNGDEWVVVDAERKLEYVFEHPDLRYPVKLKGVVDRIDRINGHWRVIDYKTGGIDEQQVKLTAIGDVFERPKALNKNKALQLLAYTWLGWKSNFENSPSRISAGIISTRGGREPYFPLSIKGEEWITPGLLEEFEQALAKELVKIFDLTGSFSEVTAEEDGD